MNNIKNLNPNNIVKSIPNMNKTFPFLKRKKERKGIQIPFSVSFTTS